MDAEDNRPMEPSGLGLGIRNFMPVTSTRTKILGTFDLSIGHGLITVEGCRLVDRYHEEGRTVYGPSVPRNATTGTYPRFVRFEADVIDFITELAGRELANVRAGHAPSVVHDDTEPDFPW